MLSSHVQSPARPGHPDVPQRGSKGVIDRRFEWREREDFSKDAVDATWYRVLAKPPWNPPDDLFGPVWTVLYVTMGIALALVLRANAGAGGRRGVLAFGVQLTLNLVWTLAFFGLREIGLAALIVGALWVAIVATMDAFSRISLAAGLLILPYLGWVTFASLLNVVVWSLNFG